MCELKASLISLLAVGNWEVIEQGFADVQLGWRQDLKPGWGKPSYVERVLNELSDTDLIALARRCLAVKPPTDTFDVQNALWARDAGGEWQLSSVTRRKIAQAFDGYRLHPHNDPATFVQLFAPLSKRRFSKQYEYADHGELRCREITFLDLAGLSGDSKDVPWHRATHLQLLNDAGFLSWPDQRVVQLLQSTVHPDARTGDEQEELVRRLEEIVKPDDYAPYKAGRLSGHHVYAFRRSPLGDFRRPKNLIFASTGPKPEIGFQDAISNDIVILKHGEHCLTYTDDLTEDGLTWHQLVTWWANEHEQDSTAEETRRALGNRLRAAVSSRAEKAFFDAYFRHVRPTAENKAPALLPQVYLHYDPITYKELYRRGEGKRFTVQRMDFLMLLPRNVRVVIEIDGKQHYSEDTSPSPRKYAQTMEADRTLQLAGYEVYRFGGYEFTQEPAMETVKTFLDALFQKHQTLHQ